MDRLLLPIITFLSSFVLVLTFYQLLLAHRHGEIQAVTDEQASFVKTKLESELGARILPLQELAGRWRVLGGDPERESTAELAMSAYPAYEAIEWVNPQLQVTWASPRSPNESDLGANLSGDRTERATFDSAQQSHAVVVSHPVTLRHGGRGMLACVPVYDNNGLAGFLVGVSLPGFSVLDLAGHGVRLLGHAV